MICAHHPKVMIRAITFDLWDTVIRDDSDEPKRTAQGLPSKRAARRQAALAAFQPGAPLPAGALEAAYDTMEAAFNLAWHQQHVTWTVAERVDILSRGLGRTLESTPQEALIATLEEMELAVMPDPVEGISDVVASLAERYALAVVSDAIYSPGRCLRQWLQAHDLLHHFHAFAFSDEIGHSKPHRDMFVHVADSLGVEFEQMLHIGDRDHNDIQGPQALGMRAILFTASRDVDRDGTSADAICASSAEIPVAVDRLAASDRSSTLNRRGPRDEQ